MVDASTIPLLPGIHTAVRPEISNRPIVGTDIPSVQSFVFAIAEYAAERIKSA